MVRAMFVAIGIVVAATACGGAASPPEAAGVSREAPDTDALVAVVAKWQCDRARFAFDSLDDLDSLLVETLAAAGVSRADYDAFDHRLGEDRELRLRVRAAFEECA